MTDKAFSSVLQRILWKIMESYGILHKKIKMIKILKADSECAVLDEVKTRRWKGLVMRKRNWRKTVEQERQELGWKTLIDTKQVATDRTIWRRSMAA